MRESAESVLDAWSHTCHYRFRNTFTFRQDPWSPAKYEALFQVLSNYLDYLIHRRKESRKRNTKDTLSINENAVCLCLCLLKPSEKGSHLTTANVSQVPALCRCSCGVEETICMNTLSPYPQETQHPKDSWVWASPKFTSDRFIDSFSPIYQKWR